MLFRRANVFTERILGASGGSGTQFCSYDLGGTDEYIDYGDVLNSTLTGVNKEFSITAIVKKHTNAVQQSIFAKWNAGDNNRSVFMRFTAADKIQIAFSSNGTAATDVNTTVASFTNTTDFYMITLKADMSTANWSGVKININGVDSPLQAASGAISSTIFAGDGDIRLGSQENGSGTMVDFFDGLYNDIAIYDAVVSDANLLTRYNAGDILGSGTIANRIFASDFVEDEWNGSEFDVIDNEGSSDGVTVNVLESEKLCVTI